MTLREFIEHEIMENHVFDIEEFGTKLEDIGWEDGEEIELKEFEDYLDYNLDYVAIINYSEAPSYFYYKISIAYEGEEIE